MERRRFLQVAGLTGLAVMAPAGIRRVRASSQKYPGPYWVMLNAGGGWDPTFLCDPKGGAINKDETANNPNAMQKGYSPDQIGTVGGHRYAPTDYQDNNGKVVYSAKAFFEKHHGKLCVINGIDTTTNNHDSGSRTTWCGQMAEGYPALAALIAGVMTHDKPVPMAFISNGGFDATEGLTSLTRAGTVDALRRIAFANRMDASKSDSPVFHTPDTMSRIAQAQAERIQAMQKGTKLPALQHAMGSLYLARQGTDGLDLMAQVLEAQKPIKTDDIPDLKGIGGLGDLENLMQQAQLALVAFTAGVAVSANLNIGGFDTHSNNTTQQKQRLMFLARGLDYLYDKADELGIGNNLFVVVGSDFGRTPAYNTANGKDHWNLTSMLASGPGIVGDRTVGQSDDEFKPMTFNSSTLKPDASGIRIETKHIHRALRKLAGVDQSEQAKLYGLAGDDLPLFALAALRVGRSR